jgi:hypothetical protein
MYTFALPLIYFKKHTTILNEIERNETKLKNSWVRNCIFVNGLFQGPEIIKSVQFKPRESIQKVERSFMK